jgi:hypothetical protein
LLSTYSPFYAAVSPSYLAFADRVYVADLENRTATPRFTAPAGESVVWAMAWVEPERRELEWSAVVTNKWVRILDKQGSPGFSAACIDELVRDNYRVKDIKRLVRPDRYRVRYLPKWYLPVELLEELPEILVDYDPDGREIARHTLPARLQVTGTIPPVTDTHEPPIRLADPTRSQTLFGLVTSPLEASLLIGLLSNQFGDFQANQGTRLSLVYQFLASTTTYFIPGAGWNMRTDARLVGTFWGLVLMNAVVSASLCWYLARRSSFSRRQRVNWALSGLLFGSTGLLLMLAVQEWPARIVCHSCGKLRRVDSDRCGKCGRSHAEPESDGTEIFEPSAPDRHRTMALKLESQ